MKILTCEDSIDGIFTAVYDIWAFKYPHGDVKIQTTQELNIELFAEYISIATDLEKSIKVTRTIYSRFGEDAYSSICQAALSNSIEKADAIYQVIRLGLRLKESPSIMNYLSNPAVCTIFQLCRQTANEAHHHLGFIRFSELANGILLSRISPKNNILTIIAPHFSDRLPMENWVIYDEGRNLALVHKAQENPVLVYSESLEASIENQLSSNEIEFQALWKVFFKSIAIKERINPNLQLHNLPKRFRGNITEFRNS